VGLKESLDNSKPCEYAEEALKVLSDKKNIVLFGAAEYGKIICDYLISHGIQPLCYSDNSVEKVGGIWNGLDIISPNEIEKDQFVVITCNAYREITNQLTGYGLQEEHIFYFDVKWLTHPNGKSKFILEHIDDFEDVYCYLEDEKSRLVFQNLLNYKLTYKKEYVSAVADEGQYFDPELVKLSNETFFIDAGSYTGDTLKEFVKFTGGVYGKVICLEPVEGNIELIKKEISKNGYHDVDIFSVGASDTEKILYFDSKNGMSARPSVSGDTKVMCDSIDHICDKNGYKRLDFIKMDIEGSEYDALLGAKNVIRKWHPILAICVYHKEDDFYKIPNLIKDIYQGYKIYFRQYELSDEETVCYAIPQK
jgi:FkbM family methyltransferase